MANRTSHNQYRPDSVTPPGRTLEEKIIEMGMSVEDFAAMAHVPAFRVVNIVNGAERISTEFALVLENITRIPARFWIARQRNYDESLLTEKNTSCDSVSLWTQRKPWSFGPMV